MVSGSSRRDPWAALPLFERLMVSASRAEALVGFRGEAGSTWPPRQRRTALGPGQTHGLDQCTTLRRPDHKLREGRTFRNAARTASVSLSHHPIRPLERDLSPEALRTKNVSTLKIK